MASQPPILPPTNIPAALANAKMDQVAVRIINLPENGRDPTLPLKISGTVAGQNQDGSITVKTDAGTIQIILRDKAPLPPNLKIDIEIPAGRAPQQAYIKVSVDQPTLAQTITQNAPTQQSAQATQNTQAAQTSQTTIIVTPQSPTLNAAPTQQSLLGEQANITQQTEIIRTQIFKAPLEAGQNVRLTPLPPSEWAQQMPSQNFVKPQPFAHLISGLVSTIENIPASQPDGRAPLIQILARLDYSPLIPQNLSAPQEPSSLPPTNPVQPALNGIAQPNITKSTQVTPPTPNITTPSPLPPAQQQNISTLPSDATILINRINTLLRAEGFQPLATSMIPQQTQSQQSVTAPQLPLALFNPTKPIDGQIIAFQSPENSLPVTLQNPPPLTSQTTISTPLTPQLSTAQMVGSNQTGLPVLFVALPQSGLNQFYTLQFAATNLTIGTPIFIALDPTSTKPAQNIFITQPDGTITLAPQSQPQNLAAWVNNTTWDSLDSLLQTLTTLSVAHTAHQSATNLLPSPAQPQNLGILSLLFLSMLRSGDVEGWMGDDALKILRQVGKTDILTALRGDIAMATRAESMPLQQDWRVAYLPLLWENQVQKTPLYYKTLRDDGEAEQNAQKRRRLRFLFDLQLSRMGGVQVDGFMQSERLDIILRTKSPLSPPMQSDMKRLYAGAMEKSRLTGDLSFQFKPEQWVDLSVSPEKTGVNA